MLAHNVSGRLAALSHSCTHTECVCVDEVRSGLGWGGGRRRRRRPGFAGSCCYFYVEGVFTPTIFPGETKAKSYPLSLSLSLSQHRKTTRQNLVLHVREQQSAHMTSYGTEVTVHFPPPLTVSLKWPPTRTLAPAPETTTTAATTTTTTATTTTTTTATTTTTTATTTTATTTTTTTTTTTATTTTTTTATTTTTHANSRAGCYVLFFSFSLRRV